MTLISFRVDCLWPAFWRFFTRQKRPRLPQELIYEILEYLHDDEEALKQCALASTKFLYPSQPHLFSSVKVDASNQNDFQEFLASSMSITNRPVDKLLISRMTNLTFFGQCDWFFNPELSLPQFPHLQMVVFKGHNLDQDSLPNPKWEFLSSIQSVKLKFTTINNEQSILEMLCKLPEQVENISFIATKGKSIPPAAPLVDRLCDHIRESNSTMHHFNGTLNLQLAPQFRSNEALLLAMLDLNDVFEFNMKTINYQFASFHDILPLASFVGKCKDTLEYLNIKYPEGEVYRHNHDIASLDFSQNFQALKRIRIQTPAHLSSDWIHKAVVSIPKPQSEDLNIPPLQIELHIKLSSWGVHESDGTLDYRTQEWIKVPWNLVDDELWRLVQPSSTCSPSAKIMLYFGDEKEWGHPKQRVIAETMFPKCWQAVKCTHQPYTKLDLFPFP